MIAVWYHCRLSNGAVPIDPEAAVGILAEQMRTLKASGLLDEADEFHVGINGDAEDAAVFRLFSPCPKANLYVHGRSAETESPTFAKLQAWLPTHCTWNILYFHSKGVTQPADAFHHHHRRVMEKAVVENWRQCVRDLERGYDAAGVNWVDPITRPVLPGRFFAGNFWWAKASFLLTLPALPAKLTWAQRCRAEGWIGSGRKRPRVMDYERPALYPL